MPTYSDFDDILEDYNWNGAGTTILIPGTSAKVPDVSGFYTFYYAYLDSQSDITATGYYDTPSNDVDLDPLTTDPEYTHFTSLTSLQKSAFDAVMHTSLSYPSYNYAVFFSDVSNINFEASAPGSAEITISQTNGGNPIFPSNDEAAYAKGYIVDRASLYGDIWLNEDFTQGWSNLDGGHMPFFTVMHELGHALGLAHPGGPLDNQKYSMMSYLVAPGLYDTLHLNVTRAYGLQLFDIVAMQELYGSRNYETRDDATTYSIADMAPQGDTDEPFLYSIWDGGGIDTIDASDSEQSVEIDLRQGRFSSIGTTANGGAFDTDEDADVDDPDPGNVSIAYHSVIEHAIGSDQADVLVGNAWSNTLSGGDGNDRLYGDGVLFDGNAGYYEIDSRDPNDPNRTRPYSDIDVLEGGDGDDALYVGQGGIDYVDGGSGSDILFVAQSLNYWTGKGVQIGGTIPVGSDHHFAENIELYRVEDGVGGYFIIHEMGNQFDNISSSNFIHTTFNYRNYHSALEFDLDVGFARDNALSWPTPSTDVFTNVGGIVGTNHGDTYTLTENHSYVHVFSGEGNDTFLGTTTTPKQVFYSGGDDTTEDKIGFTLPVGIEISDLGFTVADVQYTHADSVNGRFYFTADLILTMGTLGTITYDDQIVFYDDYDDFYYGITQVIPNIFVQLTDGIHAILPDYNLTYPYGTPVPSSFTVESLYAVTNSAFWGTWGNDSFSFVTYDNQYGDDIYYAMGGDDVITTANRDMQVWAGEGNDTILFSGAFSSYAWTLSDHLTFTRGGADIEVWSAETFHFGDNVTVTSTELETSIQGSASAEMLVGNGSRNLIMSQGGDDELSGLAGDDVLNGDDDDDTLYGGSGSDELNGGNGADFLVGGTGDNLLAGGAGDDAYVYSIGDGYDEITEEGGFDSILLGAGITEGDLVFSRVGNDLLISSAVLIAGFYSGDPDAVVEEIRFSDNSTLDLTQLLPIFGTSGDDSLSGNAFGNYIYGLAGYDDLEGGDGDDVIEGGDDDDVLRGGAGDDHLDGGDGNDSAWYSTSFFDSYITESSGTITVVGEGTDTVVNVEGIVFNDIGIDASLVNTINYGTSIADFMFGSSSDDYILGRSGNDVIHGYAGWDYLGGGDGNDILYGGDDDDYLSGGDGDDELYANTDTVFTGWYDILRGDGGNDLLVGSMYDNYFEGGDGNDTLIGMGGNDQMYGGAGDDTFVFKSTGGVATINDFDEDDDILDLSDLLTAFDPLTDLIADFVSFSSWASTTVTVDRDGTGTAETWINVAYLMDVSLSTNVQDHVNSGMLIV